MFMINAVLEDEAIYRFDLFIPSVNCIPNPEADNNFNFTSSRPLRYLQIKRGFRTVECYNIGRLFPKKN